MYTNIRALQWGGGGGGRPFGGRISKDLNSHCTALLYDYMRKGPNNIYYFWKKL